MNERKRPEFVRTCNENTDVYERHLFGESRLAGYVLATLIGATCAFGALLTRGCYHKAREMYDISKREPHVQGRPTR